MPSNDAVTLAAFGIIAFLIAVLGMISIAHAYERRHRGIARARLQTLLATWRRYATNGNDARPVRRQARAADGPLFWNVLETLDLELVRAERRRLSAILERSRHVTRERQALREDSPWRRELAARRLSLIHARAARRALRRTIECGPEPVAFIAALGLAQQRDAWTLRWILDHPFYFAARPSRARTGLLRAFGPGATPLLAQRLATGIGSPPLERAVIERLGAAGHAESAGAIAQRLTSPHLELRVAAARALGRLRSTEHADALTAALSDHDWEVRAQAAHALGVLGVADAVPALAAALSDRSWWVRRHAAYGLTELGIEGNAALSGEARISRDRYAREMAAEALATRENTKRSA